MSIEEKFDELFAHDIALAKFEANWMEELELEFNKIEL